jgi:glutamate racemase
MEATKEATTSKQINKIVEAFASNSIEVVVACRTATVVVEVDIKVTITAIVSIVEGSTDATVAGEGKTTTTIATKITDAIGEGATTTRLTRDNLDFSEGIGKMAVGVESSYQRWFAKLQVRLML